MTNLNYITALLVIVILFHGCHTGDGSDLFNKQEIHLKDRALHYWDKRVNKNDAEKALYFLSKYHSVNPDDLDIAILYSRACYFNGYYIEKKSAKQDSLYLEGYQIAKKIIYNSKLFQDTFHKTIGDSSVKELKGIEALDKKSISALYWCTANLGRYLIHKPVVDRLKYRDLLETIIHKLLSLDPTYFYGGGYRMLGTFYIRLPGTELSKAKQYFDQAIQTYPNYLGTKVLLAKYYYTKSEEKEHFHRILLEVKSADPTLTPEIMPENIYEQKIAEKLLEAESSLFE